MAHHSDSPFDDDEKQAFIRELQEMMRDEPLIGATGLYPEGKLTKHDEGGIQFAVKNHDGKVIMDFGKPVHWVGMNPQDACDLAATLIRQARIAAKKTGEPITVTM